MKPCQRIGNSVRATKHLGKGMRGPHEGCMTVRLLRPDSRSRMAVKLDSRAPFLRYVILSIEEMLLATADWTDEPLEQS